MLGILSFFLCLLLLFYCSSKRCRLCLVVDAFRSCSLLLFRFQVCKRCKRNCCCLFLLLLLLGRRRNTKSLAWGVVSLVLRLRVQRTTGTQGRQRQERRASKEKRKNKERRGEATIGKLDEISEGSGGEPTESFSSTATESVARPRPNDRRDRLAPANGIEALEKETEKKAGMNTATNHRVHCPSPSSCFLGRAFAPLRSSFIFAHVHAQTGHSKVRLHLLFLFFHPPIHPSSSLLSHHPLLSLYCFKQKN